MSLRITASLKDHMVRTFGLAADADEQATRKAVSDEIMSGKLDIAKIGELTKADDDAASSRVKSLVADGVKGVADEVGALKAGMGAILKHLGLDGTQEAGDGATDAARTAATKVTEGELGGTKAAGTGSTESTTATTQATSDSGQKGYAMAGANGGNGTEAGQEAVARVKAVTERYNSKSTAATFDMRANGDRKMPQDYIGSQFKTASGGDVAPRFLDMPSEKSLAITGAWFKHLIRKAYAKQGRPLANQHKMSQEDELLIKYAAHECRFVGPIGFRGDAGVLDDGGSLAWCEGRKLADASDYHSKEFLVKAILDDSTSGGLEAVPIEFDDNFILTPLLTGELFPLVNIINVNRRRIEATKFGNLTMSWGTSEGSSISLFNTDSFISAFDNTIYPVSGAVEVGLDFLADSPLNVGQIMVNEYGKRFRKEMDDVIADGSGTDRPEGLFQASGLSSVTPAGGAGAAQQIGDYESLYFSIAKEYRQEPGARFIYLSTDTSYSRARGIPVDSSADERRIFGVQNQENYTLFGNRPYKVTAASGVTNAEIMGVMINRYRLYRRQGLEVRVVTEDKELARKNQQMIVVRARFGGSLEDANAAVKITTGQA